MDYLLVATFVLGTSFFAHRYCKNKRIEFFVFFLISIILFCAGRKIVPNIANCDAYSYSQLYKMAHGYSFQEYMVKMGGSEYLFYGFFWICAKVGLSYTVVRIIYYLVMSGVLWRLFKELDLDYTKYSDYWFLVTNFVLSYCLMRNTLAYTIGWLAIALCTKKRYRRAVVCALLGTLVHSTCIVIFAFILFIFATTIIRRFWCMLIVVLFSYALVLYVFPQLLEYLGKINDKVAYYLVRSGAGSFALLTNLSRISILLILILAYFARSRFRSDLQYRMIMLLVLFSFFVVFAQFVNSIAYRFLAYFNVINIMAFNYIRKNKSDTLITIGNIELKNIIILGINFLWFIMFLIRDTTGYGLIPVFF